MDSTKQPQLIEVLDFRAHINPVLSWILASLVALFCGIMFNALLVNRDTVSRRTHLPAFGFIVFSSLAVSPSESLSSSIAIMLCLIALMNFSRLTFGGNSVSALFFGGFFIALASTALPELAFFMLIAAYIFADAKVGAFRAFFLTLIGFATAIYFTWTGYFMFDKGFVFVDHYLSGFELTTPSLIIDTKTALRNILLVVFGLLGLMSTLNSDAWRNVQPRRWLSFFLLLALSYGVIGLFIENDFGPTSIVSLALSVLMAHFFLIQKRQLLRQVVSLLLFAFAIAGQLISAQIISIN